MIGHCKKAFLALVFVSLALTSTRADAETDSVPNQFENIFQIIEGLVLQGGALPSSVAIGGCKPQMTLGFPSVTLKFVASATCQLNGDIRFSLFPFGASVRLEIMNNPYLTAFDIDFAMRFTRVDGNRVFQWGVTNGRVAFRFGAGLPLNEWSITGAGTRTRTKESLTIASRLNFFDKTTGAGTAILRNITRTKGAATVRDVKACALTGATPDNITSGSLNLCSALR